MKQSGASGNSFSYLETKKISRTAGFCAKFALIVMVLGSVVRATDSGLACPDWPFCFGSPIPHFDTRILLEWSHRLIAGLFSLATLYLGYQILRSKEHRRRYFVLMFFTFLLLTWQIILGALTVLELLNPKIVSWHLMNAVVLYSVLELIAVKADGSKFGSAAPAGFLAPKVFRFLLVLTALVFIQLIIGGMVSSNEAGLMCPDFPKCFGSWWPEISWLSSLHMVHRFMAFFIVSLTMIVALVLIRTPLPPRIRRTVSFLPLIVAGQILLGAINVLWHLPAWASASHLALALLIYSQLLIATAECFFVYTPRSNPENASNRAASCLAVEVKA